MSSKLAARCGSPVRFDIFYAVSNNRLNYRGLEHAKAVIGDEPTGGA